MIKLILYIAWREKEMLKRVKKSLGSILLSLLMVSSLCVETLAASQPNSEFEDITKLENEVVQLDCIVVGHNQIPTSVPYATFFADAAITISFDSEGMHIDICTGMNGIASVVGAKDIEVHRKTLFSYEVVAVADGGELYNVTTVLNSMVYTNAVQGEKYRVVCTHYGDVDGYREMYAETDWVTCNY